jgi:hypothetical protein
MSAASKLLKATGGHFAPRDWDYTRDTDIAHIRFRSDTKGKNRFRFRLKSALKTLVRSKTLGMFAPEGFWRGLVYQYFSFLYVLKLDHNTPDGSLNRGTVLTFWEEDGEYIQLVQPSVGLLLADFLEKEESNPHAVLIAAEIERIATRYQTRI